MQLDNTARPELPVEPWPYGLKRSRFTILNSVPCSIINELGMEFGLGTEPRTSIPEIIRNLPEKDLPALMCRIKRQIYEEARVKP